MTERGQNEPLGIRAVTFRNDSGETIPAFGVIKISDTVQQQDIYLYKGEKPDPDTTPSHLVFYINGPFDVVDGDEGLCYVPTSGVWALYDSANTPAVNESWGPAEGSWELSKDGTGFLILSSETSDGKVIVQSQGGCSSRNEFWQLSVLGSPTGGTFDMDLTVNGTKDTLTFDYNSTAAQVKTELATHTNIVATDLDVTGGDFPDSTINIEFKGDLANSFIPAPVFDWSSLTGGNGMAVILGRYQPGYPIDAS